MRANAPGGLDAAVGACEIVINQKITFFSGKHADIHIRQRRRCHMTALNADSFYQIAQPLCVGGVIFQHINLFDGLRGGSRRQRQAHLKHAAFSGT